MKLSYRIALLIGAMLVLLLTAAEQTNRSVARKVGRKWVGDMTIGPVTYDIYRCTDNQMYLYLKGERIGRFDNYEAP